MPVHEWAASLEGLRDQVWKRLLRGVNDRRAAGRHPTLATVDAGGMPQLRTVVLRAADRQAATLRVYSDCNAAKVAQLAAHPSAGIHIWDRDAHLQIRVMAKAEVMTGEPMAPLWEKIPEHARCNYGTQPRPGEAIDEGLAYERIPRFEDFAVITLVIQEFDALHLGHQHRRALFRREDDWQGQWLAP